MQKILFYTDCFVYSGSENVIENLLSAKEIGDKYSTRLYYAHNASYEKAVRNKLGTLADIRPLKILNGYSRWKYPLQLDRGMAPFKRNYYRARYLMSVFFRKAGFHHLYNGYVLFRCFKKERPDILFINNGGYPGAESCRSAAISARLAGIRRIVFVVNNMASPPRHYFDRLLDHRIGKAVTKFVTASKAARDHLISQRGFKPEQCLNIPNTLSDSYEKNAPATTGMLRKEFEVPAETAVLGSVGLLTYRKGFHVLIEAMKQIKGYPCRLFIFGEGEERPALETQIKNSGLEHMVTLAGFRNNILSYVTDFDIFIIPSVANEDFPYVVIEAMMLGKPVIGTNIAGIPEQVEEGVNGFVANAGDAGQLAGAIQKLVATPARIKELGENGRIKYAQNFSNNIVICRYLHLFESL